MRVVEAGGGWTVPWTLERGNRHYERALERLPFGVAADFGYRGDGGIGYVRRASGARFWDVGDKEYIDYWLAGGALILGHADARIAQAVRGANEAGTREGRAESEFAVARQLSKLVPAAEGVRCSNSVSDAVSDALRCARAFTGKRALAVVEGGFHGMPRAHRSAVGRPAAPQSASASPRADRARGASESTIYILRANDADGFEALLRGRADRIGALLVEAVPVDYETTDAAAAYFSALRALCDRFEVVLIVDEVVTGFRAARGGAQQVVGVRADLCIFGPSAASGFPFAALAGRGEILRAIGDDVAARRAGAAHPASLAAARETLEIIAESDAVERITRYGWRLREGISQVLSRRGISHAFVGPPSMSRLRFGETIPGGEGHRGAEADDFRAELAPRLRSFGIACGAGLGGPWFTSTAHNELCLAETLAKFEHAADSALERLAQAPGRETRATPRPPRSFANPG